MTTPLPKTRTFITSLISSLPKPTSSNSNEEPPRNPLKALTENQRAILMTLHVLFPNELLPALDLLDRDLVSRYRIRASSLTTTTPDAPADGVINSRDEASTATASDETANQSGNRTAATTTRTPIYYVRSAQSTSTNSNSKRYRDPLATSTHYEVRPHAWSCSCPAFTFAAFPFQATLSSHQSSHQSSHHQSHHQSTTSLSLPHSHSHSNTEAKPDAQTKSCFAGGLSTGQEVPICKHLLACTLVEQTGLFGAFVREREVSFEEMVGWAAGWGG
ncbi:hypothetical protein BDV97DRAFT_114382 [Delphinella strobiligena]|nr:hypothetical protein BDV97DRAFT_114382 [Delphinella strobiligena]